MVVCEYYVVICEYYVHISSRGGSETTPLMSKGTDEILEEAVVVGRYRNIFICGFF